MKVYRSNSEMTWLVYQKAGNSDQETRGFISEVGCPQRKYFCILTFGRAPTAGLSHLVDSPIFKLVMSETLAIHTEHPISF